MQQIQSAITEATKKNQKVDKEFLSRLLQNIARMAPDVFGVVVTLGNRLAGLGVEVEVRKRQTKPRGISIEHIEPKNQHIGNYTDHIARDMQAQGHRPGKQWVVEFQSVEVVELPQQVR